MKWYKRLISKLDMYLIKKFLGTYLYNKRNVSDGFAEDVIESIIIEKARDYRKSNPGLGAAKLHAILKQIPTIIIANTQT